MNVLLARPSRWWSRRRPAPTPDSSIAYGRRCALLNPVGRPAARLVANYQDAHVGTVDRGMVRIEPGQHRAPDRSVTMVLVDEYATVPLPRVSPAVGHAETARIVLGAFPFSRPVPSAVSR